MRALAALLPQHARRRRLPLWLRPRAEAGSHCEDCRAARGAGRRCKAASPPCRSSTCRSARPRTASSARWTSSARSPTARRRFEPGLLARAHRGFLYIDEVNLLEDHLVDLLLDVAASGENVVEREGLSVRHPARFVLVGSGNPEEGELRPQLLDRFGLAVEVQTPADLPTRVEVVRRRDAFDRDPAGFAERWSEQEASPAPQDRWRRASRLAAVDVPDGALERAARALPGARHGRPARRAHPDPRRARARGARGRCRGRRRSPAPCRRTSRCATACAATRWTTRGSTVRVERALAEVCSAAMSAAAVGPAASARAAGRRTGRSRSSRFREAVWADAHLAAALFAVDPAGLGGIVLRARAGPVRDAWLRCCAGSVAGRNALAPRVPLGITDDRLLGGLDLAADAARRAGRSPSAACWRRRDGGVRAPRHGRAARRRRPPRVWPPCWTRARLCSSATGLRCARRRASAWSRWTRASARTSRSPPALADRLAFPDLDLCQRSSARAQSGMAPAAAVEAWTSAHAEIAAARALLPAVSAGRGQLSRRSAPRPLALGIDSLRRAVLALRAARAAAALDGATPTSRTTTSSLAARLVLAPRAALAAGPGQAPEEQAEPGQQDQAAGQARAGHARRCTGRAAARQHRRRSRTWCWRPTPAPRFRRVSWRCSSRREAGARRASAGKAAPRADHARSAAGRSASAPGEPRGGARLTIVETLRAAAPWQRLRRRRSVARAGASRRASTRARPARRPPRRALRAALARAPTIFAVDASGSAALHRLGEAKGAVELLLADCYVRRDQVALLAFRGKAAELLLPPTRSLVRAEAQPRRACPAAAARRSPRALDAALALADAAPRKGQTPLLVLLTDGQANIARDGRRRAHARRRGSPAGRPAACGAAGLACAADRHLAAPAAAARPRSPPPWARATCRCRYADSAGAFPGCPRSPSG